MSETTSSSGEANLGKYGPAFAIIGVVSLIVTGVLASSNLKPVMQSYVFAVMLFMSATLGCFALTLLQHTLQGKWGLPILRIFESGGGVRNFVLMVLLFVPIGIFAKELYPWANPALVSQDAVLQHRQPYLNWTFLLIRFGVCFAIWLAYAYFMRQSVRAQEANGRYREQQRRAWWCPPGIVLFFITLTFAYTDWIMALDAHWWSTMYPLWFATGMALGAVSFAAVISCLNADKAPYNRIVNKNWTRDIGNLMLTFTMLWGYTNLGQYLILWHGNLPETATYLVNRSIGHWSYMSFALVIGHFFIPFFALCSPTVKAKPKLLAMVGIWILIMRVTDHFHVVEPFFRPEMTLTFADIFALLGVGGLWAWMFSLNINKLPLFPTYDPRILEAEHAH